MRTFVALSTIPLENKQNQAVPVLGYLSSQVIGAVAFSCRVGLLLASGSDSRRRWSGYVQGQCSQSATDGNCHFYDCTSCEVQVKLDFDRVLDKLFFFLSFSYLRGIHIKAFRGVQSAACFFPASHHLRPSCSAPRGRLTGNA